MPWSSVTAPPSPQMNAAISPRVSAASWASSPPSPTTVTSFSGSQPCCFASITAKTQVAAPTRVTPIDLPLRSPSALIVCATFRVKWFPSTWEAMNRIGTPVARNTGTSVAPVTPIWICPATTALTRSGPPRNGWNSTATPCPRKKPFSCATTIGATIEKSARTAVPIFTVGPWAATGRTRPTTPLAATSPPAVTWKNWRREVSMAVSPLTA